MMSVDRLCPACVIARSKATRHFSPLDGSFSAGDLLMVNLLPRLKGSGLLEEYPGLCAYVARGEARPAFQRAFAARLAVFTANSPTD